MGHAYGMARMVWPSKENSQFMQGEGIGKVEEAWQALVEVSGEDRELLEKNGESFGASAGEQRAWEMSVACAADLSELWHVWHHHFAAGWRAEDVRVLAAAGYTTPAMYV